MINQLMTASYATHALHDIFIIFCWHHVLNSVCLLQLELIMRHLNDLKLSPFVKGRSGVVGLRWLGGGGGGGLIN